MSAIEDAKKLVYGERAKSYGPFEQNVVLAAQIAGTTIDSVLLTLIGIKLAREKCKHKRDNLVDIIGYVELWDQIKGGI